MSEGGLLAGKRVLVTGVLNHESIAFAVARIAQEQGAEVLLTSLGRVRSITERAARRLPDPPDVVELDVSDESHFDALAQEIERRVGRCRRCGPRHRQCPRQLSRRRLPDSTVGRRRQGNERVHLFAGGPGSIDGSVDATRGRSWGWTSTPSSHGLRTTGWEWPKPGSSPPRATSPGTSGPREFGSTWWRPDHCGRWQPVGRSHRQVR